MRLTRRSAALATAALLLSPLPASALVGDTTSPARVQDWLAGELAVADAATPIRVFVHATDAATARRAATASGLVVQETWDAIGVAVAVGLPASVEAVRLQPGVSFVEGDAPVVPLLDSSHEATRGAEAMETLTGADGTALTGTGVSIAVIDSGIDGTHPSFQEADGTSKVVRNLKSACIIVTFTGESADRCFVDVPGNDSDSPSLGGHGTHVAGIAAGLPVETGETPSRTIMGAAPGAKLVGLSVGAAVSVYGGNSGLNWVVNNHAAPCGEGVPATECPPIKVTNNSYGTPGGSDFDPESAAVKLQRALLDQGVVTVWAAGNDGGDGSGEDQTTNGPAKDPRAGILMVASYDDGDTGTRDGVVSDFSSRGQQDDFDSYPDISAPGSSITAACRAYLPICSTGFDPVDGGDFNTISGTSMAAPHIAGIVAQLFQADPQATPAQIEDAIEDGAYAFTDGASYQSDPLNPDSETSFDKGHGLVDVVAAVADLLEANGGTTDGGTTDGGTTDGGTTDGGTTDGGTDDGGTDETTCQPKGKKGKNCP